MKRKVINKNPTKFCMKCGSRNIKMIYKGVETDQYKCSDCKTKYGVTDLERW